MNRALWIVQGILAALFLFAGGSKLVTPPEVLAAMSPFPAAFILFIGVCEILGALGLVLPMALKIRPELTELAALGLTIIMVGATLSTVAIGMGGFAVIPLAIALLTAVVAYGRRDLLSIPRRGTVAVNPA